VNVTAAELVAALTVAEGMDEDQELDDYLIDSLAGASATLIAVLDEILKATKEDERILL
jgi:hypothetical protein